ncbi:hypothetical protein ASPWEDRAFT_46539 [Aspergillus wentii DTO 134E9]|uniref:GPI anchored protein n=1 Tax=Aspergillus wentii DTO 134E9 TaxID=1073089 RepID=A0A1L9R4D4_ASPWE|nr:uncharacterized protein ASPWEDRAFT_46539 [Aspergillus wentii DTO 134E9]KAI9927060.1 hypothetical protein MW887_003442 [Aspergillus wentii]OJJ29779.1 hypothetical protein ASPWEDRAFT_46539 [Aspergillus wentii DTO 134E9]
MTRKLLGLFLAGLVSAESTVISMFIPQADPQPLAASIVGNDATATTYSINCPPGTDGSDCGMGLGLTLIAGPTTTKQVMDDPIDDMHWTMICSVGGTTTAVCTESASGSAANFPGVSTASYDKSDISLLPVTVTAGSVTSVDATATATTEASTATSATTAKSTESSGSFETSTRGSTASSSNSSTTSTSTGGVAHVTGEAVILTGGAAVALAAVFL